MSELIFSFIAFCTLVGFIVACVCVYALAYAAWQSAKGIYRDWQFDRACRLHAKKMAEATREEPME